MKTAFYEELRKVGLSSAWLDKILAGGSRSRYLFLTPERLPLTFIMQLSLIVRLPVEETIELLWKQNLPDSKYFTNEIFKQAILVQPPPSLIKARKHFVLKPHSEWYPLHLREGMFANAVYERGYRPQDLDKYMRFPNSGTYNWLRHPLTISTIPDFIRLAAFMNCTFTEAFNYFLMMETKEINIPLVLPPKISNSRKTTLSSMGTFDMLRMLKQIDKI